MSKEYTITPQGSLGLLALGHVGIKRWKEVEQGEVVDHEKVTKWLDSWENDDKEDI